MQHPRFMRREHLSLQSLYEHNYMLFRLLLPKLPNDNQWYGLYSHKQCAPIYIRRLSLSPYTSEWLLGHFFPHKKTRQVLPDHTIRVYHDARLAEAMVASGIAVSQLRNAKRNQNRALGEWLDYCRRYHYCLDLSASVVLSSETA